jgi:hypothetical protein
MSFVISRLTDTYCVYMPITTVFKPVTYERSDLTQLYSLFYPHVNSLTDVSITPVLRILLGGDSERSVPGSRGSPNISVAAKAGMLGGEPSPAGCVYYLYGALWL